MNEKKYNPRASVENWLKVLSANDSALKSIDEFVKQIAQASGLTTKEIKTVFYNNLPVPPKTKEDKLTMWKENITLKLKLKAAQKRIQELEAKLQEE